MKYRYLEARGYWDDNPQNAFDVKIAIDNWDGNECEDDMQIFTYLDEDESLMEGDIISDNFTIVKIYGLRGKD
jgi:hypothetical protein